MIYGVLEARALYLRNSLHFVSIGYDMQGEQSSPTGLVMTLTVFIDESGGWPSRRSP